jgi:hypothetical protein
MAFRSLESPSPVAWLRNYVEAMLRQQLVAAIGKEVTVADFTAYMRHWDAHHCAIF